MCFNNKALVKANAIPIPAEVKNKKQKFFIPSKRDADASVFSWRTVLLKTIIKYIIEDMTFSYYQVEVVILRGEHNSDCVI